LVYAMKVAMGAGRQSQYRQFSGRQFSGRQFSGRQFAGCGAAAGAGAGAGVACRAAGAPEDPGAGTPLERLKKRKNSDVGLMTSRVSCERSPVS